ncbi:alpha/beta hydrolase [Rugamonas rubra]|jgi:acetyl esterase/lipase|uniref:Acetyl esterase/lipase n=1 Tax=Rugamonas rubra TaxID=758825 RepID=A0A1I4QFI5_9BURK|nr:alpha/beta hydrolase [Rugamonas rubra]SFM38882.1 Acetyl esterase/lipase [Rugamonas rubra]
MPQHPEQFPAAAQVTAPLSLQDYLALGGRRPDRHIAYGDAPSQFVELFMPAGAGPFPLVVLIHGGCWTVEFGGIAQMHNMAEALSRQGIAVWNVEYRRVDEAGGGYPGTYRDVAEAIDLLRDVAPQHGLDLGRLVLLGHSAGGHLAQWAAARARLPEASPLYVAEPLPATGLISLGGLADLRREEALIKSSCARDMVQLTGLPSAARPDVFADTSPGELLPVGLPTALIHGQFDTVSPPRAGADFAKRARIAGDKVEFIVLPGASHYDEVAAGSPAWLIVGARIRAMLGLAPAQ